MNNNDDLKNNNSNQNQNESTERKNDFASELDEQKKSLDAEKFAKQQEQYRQMLPDVNQNLNQNNLNNNPYQWRIGFGRRVGAYLIDTVFLILLFFIAMMFTSIGEEIMDLLGGDTTQMMLNPEELTESIIQILMPLVLAVTFIYYSLEVIFARTPGKMLLGMIIGTDERRFASYSQLFVRLAIKHLSSFFSLFFVLTAISLFQTFSTIAGFVIYVGCLFALSLKKQALHDTVARTAVYFKDELQQFDNRNDC